MSWKVRHEGSPQAVEIPTAQQVAAGLIEGLWEPTDEVMGPDNPTWVPLENHPTFAEVAAEVEPPPPRHYDDETHLDMNALIDVCLVLLIFFILTASYAALQSRIDSPELNFSAAGTPVMTPDDVDQFPLIKVTLEEGKPVIRLEDKVIERNRLRAELAKARSNKGRNTLLVQIDRKVPHEVSVFIQDAAYGSFTKVLRLVPEAGAAPAGGGGGEKDKP